MASVTAARRTGGAACAGSRSALGALHRGDAIAQRLEVHGIGTSARRGLGALEQQRPQVQPFLVAPDQLADLFARSAVAASVDLFVEEVAQHIRQGDVHRGH
jgi:hypothetical protein